MTLKKVAHEITHKYRRDERQAKRCLLELHVAILTKDKIESYNIPEVEAM